MALCSVPLSCRALTYLLTLADNGKITRREAYLSTKLCSRILNNRKMVQQFAFTIKIGNLTQRQFIEAYDDMPLTCEELAALYHALTS